MLTRILASHSPCALAVALALAAVAPLAHAEGDDTLIVSISGHGDVVDVYGKAPWTSPVKGTPPNGTPQEDWKPFIWQDKGFLGDKLHALPQGTNVLHGSQITSRVYSPAWAQVTGRTYQPLAGNNFTLVLCPLADGTPDLAKCLKPADTEGVQASTKRRGNWPSMISTLTLGGDPAAIISPSERTDKLASIDTQNKNAAAARAAEQARQDAENQKQAAERQRQQERAKAEWDRAQHNTAYACNMGNRLVPQDFSLADTQVECRLTSGATYSVRISDALATGWAIENQMMTPAVDALSRPRYALNLVLRKR